MRTIVSLFFKIFIYSGLVAHGFTGDHNIIPLENTVKLSESRDIISLYFLFIHPEEEKENNYLIYINERLGENILPCNSMALRSSDVDQKGQFVLTIKNFSESKFGLLNFVASFVLQNTGGDNANKARITEIPFNIDLKQFFNRKTNPGQLTMASSSNQELSIDKFIAYSHPNGKGKASKKNDPPKNSEKENSERLDSNPESVVASNNLIVTSERDSECVYLSALIPNASIEDNIQIFHWKDNMYSPDLYVTNIFKDSNSTDGNLHIRFIPLNGISSSKLKIKVKSKSGLREFESSYDQKIKFCSGCIDCNGFTRKVAKVIPDQHSAISWFDVILISLAIILAAIVAFFSIRLYKRKFNSLPNPIATTTNKSDSGNETKSEPFNNKINSNGDGSNLVEFTENDEFNETAIFEKVQIKDSKVLTSGNGLIKYYNISDFFEDTAVECVYVSREVAKDIFEFVEKSVAIKPVPPEVGGYLMGRVEKKSASREKYDVYIDYFVKDDQPLKQDIANLTFSLGAAVEANDYMEKTPGSVKVGWLHTHPGHSVFLSETDVISHTQSFPYYYQIAIVIDVLSDFLTGTFSYKSGIKESGIKELNNVDRNNNAIPAPVFFNWTEML